MAVNVDVESFYDSTPLVDALARLRDDDIFQNNPLTGK